MPSFYKSSVEQFLQSSTDIIVGALSAALIKQFSGDHSRQLSAWRQQVDLLQHALSAVSAGHPLSLQWGVLFEFPLLRLQRRLDIVLLAGQHVLVIEFKVGATIYQSSDIQQVEDYALDLRDFHEASHDLPITPLLCATQAPHKGHRVGWAPGVRETVLCNAETLAHILADIAGHQDRSQINFEAWEASPYKPVPSIIEAAELLYAGHEVQEIAHASSEPENLGATTDRLIEIIASAQQNSRHVVVFVTGVPGSGKTLVGLNAIHDSRFRQDNRAAGAFLSGNTPLVTVLREALARDDASRTGKTLRDARREVKSEIQGLMGYLQEYLTAHPDHSPADHVIVFDEAQRAWDADYGAQKFDRPMSEPALFLEIMERHPDWAVIIALVGGGQEINRGEHGLSEWGAALEERDVAATGHRWQVIAAPDVVTGGDSTAWQSLLPEGQRREWIERDERLHLSVSVRSYRCLATTQWVNALLEGRIHDACRVAEATSNFPVYITRSLGEARHWLLDNARGTRRCGLVATSGARRLRADGLGVTLSATELSDVANWYLRPRGDIRSSFALEVAANEYTCQGLELDYVGLCWGGDLLWDGGNQRWRTHKLSGAKWQTVKKADNQRWILNKYRVLLTRSRLGTVIWVPEGNAKDATRDPLARDAVAEVLQSAGARPLPKGR